MNSSFVTLMYPEHISSLDLIIVRGTDLQLESMIELHENLCHAQVLQKRTNIWNRNLSLHHTDHLCHLVPSLSDLLGHFVVVLKTS